MKVVTKFAVIVAFATALFVSAASAQVNSRVVRAADDGSTITVSVGTQLDCLLDAHTLNVNEWAVKSISTDAVTLSSEDHYEGDAVRPDGTFAAVYEGVFHAAHTGKSTIQVVGLDDNGKPASTFTLTVIVQ